MAKIDPDHNGMIERAEFVDAILNYVYERAIINKEPAASSESPEAAAEVRMVRARYSQIDLLQVCVWETDA